jgi:hypothetical protein
VESGSQSTVEKRKLVIKAHASGGSSWVKSVKGTSTTPSEEVLSGGDAAGVYTMLTGATCTVRALPRGYACKARRRVNEVYTMQQINYVEWCYLQGVKGRHGGHPGKKYTADRAAKEMRLYGTLAGSELHPDEQFWTSPEAKAFDYRELLDKYAFKAWFSKQKDLFGKAIQNAKAKVVPSIKEVVVDDGEDMDEEME